MVSNLALLVVVFQVTASMAVKGLIACSKMGGGGGGVVLP